MPYSHYHNGAYHTHYRRRRYGRHYWVGRRGRSRRGSWTTPILFILLAVIAVGGIVYFVRPDIISNVAQGVAQDATMRDAEREADRARKLDLLERQVATLTNIEREQHGLRPLLWDSALRDIARSHSQDMAAHDYFEHRNQEGENATQRGLKAGYRCAKGLSVGLGENISFTSSGYFTPEDTVQRWMDSPGHRVNMLDPMYDRLGIGIHEGRGTDHGRGHYTTMVLC